MTKRPKRHEKTPASDIDFDEALGRIAPVSPSELPAMRSEVRGPVPLMEDDTGHRFLVYVTDKGARHELRYAGEQPWFTQKQLADMFGVDTDTIGLHIKNFIESGELAASTTEKYSVVRLEGNRQVRRSIAHYTLDVAFYVGYRVNSAAGVLFRKWATAILIQFATKGYVIDKARLKEPDARSRIDEIKEILQDIRSEQANVYRELESICAQCADYDSKDPKWQKFFRETSAAIFFAAVQRTPSEVILERADATHESMGLFTWPNDNVRKADVTVGKNYLGRTELDDLNRFSSLLLDFILDQAKSGRMVTMDQAARNIVNMTELSGRIVLRKGGGVSRKTADARAHDQYAIYDARRKAARQLRGDHAFDESDQE
jgi:hypothetical protein